jgi:hypothetical protein
MMATHPIKLHSGGISRMNYSNHPQRNGHYVGRTGPTDLVSTRGLLSLTMLLISMVSLSIALFAGAVLALSVLLDSQGSREGIWYKILAIGLSYLVGWIVALVAVRAFHNLVLPILINVYAWLVLFGISGLYIAIIGKLFRQAYTMESFIKYAAVMAGGLVALIGLHLLVENHRLRLFAVPLLVISLCHLYLIVFHYVIVSNDSVQYEKLWGDVAFFLGMALVSVLMLAHLGVMNGLRRWIDNLFDGKAVNAEPPKV